MQSYFELQPDIYTKYVPKIVTILPDDISFIDGVFVHESFPLPLIFSSGHSMKEPPKGLHGELIPIMSDTFIKALQAAGVSNLQSFPIELRSRVDNTVWTNYQVVNVIGLISCANLAESEFTNIIDRPAEESPPLLAFEYLKIYPSRARGALLFRLAESPGTIIVASNVVEFLRSQQTDDEWGVTFDEIST